MQRLGISGFTFVVLLVIVGGTIASFMFPGLLESVFSGFDDPACEANKDLFNAINRGDTDRAEDFFLGWTAKDLNQSDLMQYRYDNIDCRCMGELSANTIEQNVSQLKGNAEVTAVFLDYEREGKGSETTIGQVSYAYRQSEEGTLYLELGEIYRDGTEQRSNTSELTGRLGVCKNLF